LKAPSLQRLIQRYELGLPTTCGYQFVYNEENPLCQQKKLVPIQYFASDGLGVAMEIGDGDSHHFLGWLFSHRTTPCLLHDQSTNSIYLNNKEELFMVYAWGRSGGGRDAAAVLAARARGASNGRGAASSVWVRDQSLVEDLEEVG
jgi:hypothetical protein